jgi:acyl carrier protein
MEIQEILDEISVIFRDVLKNNDIALKEETVASDVQGWDSLTNMRLITAVEKHYGLRFSLREVLKFKNVGDLCRVIQNKVA